MVFFSKYISYLAILDCASFYCLKLVLVEGFYNIRAFSSYLPSFFVHSASRTKHVFFKPVVLEGGDFRKAIGK